MSRPGFTLLEVLLAVSLLAAITAATFSWVTTMSRTNRAAAQRLQALTTIHAIGSALRDDLLQALPDERGRRFEQTADQIQLRTMNRMPEDPAGAQLVRWRHDRRLGGLVRELVPPEPDAKPVARVVSRELESVRFSLSAGTLLLTCRATGQVQEMALPLTLKGLP